MIHLTEKALETEQASSLQVKLGIRLGEQIVASIGSRKEQQNLYTGRYINNLMEQFKKEQVDKVA